MNRAKLSFDLKYHVLCIKLLPLLLCFHVLWGQELEITPERINIFNYYNKNHLNFEIEDKYDEQGKASGTVVTLTIPLDFRTREK